MFYGNTFLGYVSIHEKNGNMVAATLDTDLMWNALQGYRVSAGFDISSIIGGASARFAGTFTSATSYRATQLLCFPNPGYVCLLPDGATVTGSKIW